MPVRSRLIPAVCVALACAALLPLAGCEQLAKARECKAVIDVLNQGETYQPKGTEESVDADIAGLETWDAKIAEVQVTDAALQGHVGDYRGMIRGIVDALKVVKEARATKTIDDPVKLQKLAKEMEAAGKTFEGVQTKQDALTEEINGYCGAK
jgi:hypothetical protein